MTTSTAASKSRLRRAGFSLVEMLIATTIAGVAMGAVLSSVLFIGRTCISTTDYTDMDAEARRALETFGRDVRMAQDINGYSNNGATLTLPTNSGTTTVTYSYNPGNKTFYRNYGASNQTALIRNIASFSLKRYTLQQTPAANDLETKQLQLELRSVRSGPARASASNNVISARFIMPNKAVSN